MVKRTQTQGVLDEVRLERTKQDLRWGRQRHPDGTDDSLETREEREEAKATCALEAKFSGGPTWKAILDEEMKEAFAETDAKRLRDELVQVAAVAVAWIEDIDTRETT